MSQLVEDVMPDELHLAGRDPRSDRPFARLTVLSKVDGLTILSEVKGTSGESYDRNRVFKGGRAEGEYCGKLL